MWTRAALPPTAVLALAAPLLALAPGSARARAVSLDVAPGTELSTTITVTSALGNDSDGPKPTALSGTAQAELLSVRDPVHGEVANWLRFTSSDIAFADTDFQLVVGIPIDISLVGIAGSLNDAVLAPGSAVASGTAEFDAAPLELEWTQGEIVAVGPPGIPAAGTVFDLMGTVEAVTLESGSALDISLTIPIQEDVEVTESGITVTTTIAGDLVLIGSIPRPPVPGLGPPGAALLSLAVLAGAGRALRPRSS